MTELKLFYSAYALGKALMAGELDDAAVRIKKQDGSFSLVLFGVDDDGDIYITESVE